MSDPLYAGAAVGYDELFARATSLFIPSLFRAAHLTPGQNVLDVATGTGVVAQAAKSMCSLHPMCVPSCGRKFGGNSRRLWAPGPWRWKWRFTLEAVADESVNLELNACPRPGPRGERDACRRPS